MHFTWASSNPEKVQCIASIYPVMDVRAYPGLNSWKLYRAYLRTSDWLAEHLREISPNEMLEPLAKAKVPLFFVHGDTDTVVPMDVNSKAAVSRYAGLGGAATLAIVKGRGHEDAKEFMQHPDIITFLSMHSNGADLRSAR